MAIKTLVPSSPDGVYWIQPAFNLAPYQAYCEFVDIFVSALLIVAA
jgi:hypothetical protein